MTKDLAEIDALMQQFLSLFTNKDGRKPKLDRIFELCIAEATIIKNVAGRSEISSLEAFIEPRRQILSDGTLTEFEEWEVSAKTQIAGHIAQRISHYRKRGQFRGEPFSTQGIKMTQLIKGQDRWRISAVTWDDEHEGFALSEQTMDHLFGGTSQR